MYENKQKQDLKYWKDKKKGENEEITTGYFKQKEKGKGAPSVHHWKQPSLVKVKFGIGLSRALCKKINDLIEKDSTTWPNRSEAIEKICWQFFTNSPGDTLRQLEYHKEEAAKLEQRIKNIKNRRELI